VCPPIRSPYPRSSSLPLPHVLRHCNFSNRVPLRFSFAKDQGGGRNNRPRLDAAGATGEVFLPFVVTEVSSYTLRQSAPVLCHPRPRTGVGLGGSPKTGRCEVSKGLVWGVPERGLEKPDRGPRGSPESAAVPLSYAVGQLGAKIRCGRA